MEVGLMDSIEVCLIGMTLVGLFLVCMICVMSMSSRIVNKYFNKANGDDKALIAAIVAAIHNR